MIAIKTQRFLPMLLECSRRHFWLMFMLCYLSPCRVGVESFEVAKRRCISTGMVGGRSLQFLLPRRLNRSPKERGMPLLSNNDEDDHYLYESFPRNFVVNDEISRHEAESLTVPQLKQQLRLRGLKVSGRKHELVDRLLGAGSKGQSSQTTILDESVSEKMGVNQQLEAKEFSTTTKAREFAKANGKDLIDVTAYVDEEDQGKFVKTYGGTTSSMEDLDNDESSTVAESSGPEVWGAEARIVEDYEGRSPIVDSLSRTIIEFRGSNQTMVQAFVVASRDSLKSFMMGGPNTTSTPQDRLREIQMKREQAAKRPVRLDDEVGLDEGDDDNLYANVLHRDLSDWGEYTVTGAQLSAQEVQGVLFLSDVYGAFSEDTKALAEKIAFECQPVVVMIPDLFRGKPWKEDPATPGFNDEGQEYEQWRAAHPDLRVSVDIRAAAACLRERYGVSSVVLWGTCFGGGRALEAAAGHMPDGGNIHDVDGAIGPVPVNPSVAVAWYPTRYNVKALFGPERKTTSGESESLAVMCIFAGNDVLDGATAADASELKRLLAKDERVKDYMVKVFPNQEHGFAHLRLASLSALGENQDDPFVDNQYGGTGHSSMNGGDAEVACLLSTAFMETYSRVFLPTTGQPISKSTGEEEWSSKLEMKDLRSLGFRDVRKEIDDAVENFVPEPLGGRRIDPTDGSQLQELKNFLRSMQPDDVTGPFKLEDDDDIDTMYAKLKAWDDSFQLF